MRSPTVPPRGLPRRWACTGRWGRIWRSEARFWQGTIHQAVGDSAAALVQFEQVVAGEAAPELACRALLQIARLRHEQSDALYEQILTECVDEDVRGLAALVLGRRYRQAGRGTEARRVLESIAPTQPQYAYAQLELAQLHVEAGKADEAIELIARQIAQTPNAELTAQLGLLHQKRGEHEQALSLLREALPQLEGATAAAAQVGLGWSLYKTGQYEAAWDGVAGSVAGGSVGRRPAARSVAGYERVCPDLGGQPAHGSSLSGDG